MFLVIVRTYHEEDAAGSAFKNAAISERMQIGTRRKFSLMLWSNLGMKTQHMLAKQGSRKSKATGGYATKTSILGTPLSSYRIEPETNAICVPACGNFRLAGFSEGGLPCFDFHPHKTGERC
jgi:hypothetical protein